MRAGSVWRKAATALAIVVTLGGILWVHAEPYQPSAGTNPQPRTDTSAPSSAGPGGSAGCMTYVYEYRCTWQYYSTYTGQLLGTKFTRGYTTGTLNRHRGLGGFARLWPGHSHSSMQGSIPGLAWWVSPSGVFGIFRRSLPPYVQPPKPLGPYERIAFACEFDTWVNTRNGTPPGGATP